MANEHLPYPESFYETTLSNSITAAQTTMVVAANPTNQSGYLVIEPKSSNREIVKFTSCNSSTNTLTVVRGLSETANFDDSSGTGKTHAAGVQVAMKDVHYYFGRITAAYRGEEITGYNSFLLGDGAAVSSANRFWYAACSSVSAFWGLSSNGQLVISEDGTTSWTISAGGSGVTAGDGISITAGVVATDLLSTGALEISSAKLAVETSSLIARDANGIRVDTTSAMEWSGLQNFTDIAIDGVQISATGAEINQMVSGTSAYSALGAYNLNLLTDGGNVSGQNLHRHFNVDMGIDSRVVSSSTGTHNIAHSLGVYPAYVRIVASHAGINGLVSQSIGMARMSSDQMVDYWGTDAVTNSLEGATTTEILRLNNGTATSSLATLSAMTSGSFTLNFTTHAADIAWTWEVHA